MKKRSIIVKGAVIAVTSRGTEDYISLTDMVKGFEGGGALIEQWLRAKDTILFLGAWEQVNNPDFNSLEFEGIRNEAGRNSFFLSAKRWIQATGAMGIEARAGRYGGTYAHRDIAFEFGSWLSPEFKPYLITEFQRLKAVEADARSLEWNVQRTLAKVNYRIHTDAIKEHLVPPLHTKAQTNAIYASEADLLNMALSAPRPPHGEAPTRKPKATSATTPRWSSSWRSPTWKASTPCSSTKGCPHRSGWPSSTPWPSHRCAHC